VAKQLACIVLLFCAAAIQSSAQTFTTLVNFEGTNGESPVGPPIQATDGNLYGATSVGGTFGWGTVFKITAAGQLTVLHNFVYNDGFGPESPLVQGSDGNLYGSTPAGGTGLGGTLYEITPQGPFQRLYAFCIDCAEPSGPSAGLAQGSKGDFYGTSLAGGEYSLGTVFKIKPMGQPTVLYDFGPQASAGIQPNGGLVEDIDGSFYGTTPETVFKITPDGALTTLYSFCAQPNCGDGSTPRAGLVEAGNGNFYGTTTLGGASNAGTVFEITPAGELSTLYSFCFQQNCADGSTPQSGLALGSNGKLYGTTNGGGAYGYGTVFQVSLEGELRTLHNFNDTDGEYPLGIMQATDGNFYGTTMEGGNGACIFGCGTIFSLSIGLRPFVATQMSAAKIGRQIVILGNNLGSSTAVSFNGTAATFVVVSDTEITATVPSGATTGFVTVTTAGDTLKSNKPFQIIP
jgi:uncharacterized repeat protein (TIGR03803 family)